MPTDTTENTERAAMPTDADRLFDQMVWVPRVDPDPDPEGKLPHVTHDGTLRIGETELACYTLSDGRRIIDADDVHALFSAVEPEDKSELKPICTWVDCGITFRAMRLVGPALRVQFQVERGAGWLGMFDAVMANWANDLALMVTEWNSFDSAVDAEQGRIVGRAQLEIQKALLA